MKQIELAKICGVSRQYIGELFNEHHKPCPFSRNKESGLVIEDEKTLQFIHKYVPEYQFNKEVTK